MQPDKPQQPNPNYDFILKDPAKNKTGPGLPSFSLPSGRFGPLIVSLVILAVVLFALVLFGGSKPKSQSLVDAAARAQEIARVSTVAAQTAGPNEADTKNLAATVATSLSSQQLRLLTYLKASHIKVSTKQEAIYKNSATDSQLIQAEQAGNLLVVYKVYLKNSFATYQSALSQAYSSASTAARLILNDAYLSNQVILNSL